MPDPNRTIEYGVAHRDEGATGGAASHVIGLLAMLIGAVTLWEASWHFLSNLACALGVVLAGICISGIVSSIRGMLTARYRRRAILGLVATAAATFLGLAALGRMLSGLH